MTAEQIEEAIKELMVNQNATINQFERLNKLLLKSEAVLYEDNLHNLIVFYLENAKTETLASVLQLLIICVKQGMFQRPTDLNLANLVLNIAQNTNFELLEKAFSVVEAMTGLHFELFKTKTQDIVNIIGHIVESEANSVQKINALNLLHKLVTNVTLNSEVQNTVITLWIEQICPLMFNMTSNLQTTAEDISNALLPTLQNLVQSERFTNFLVTVEKTYLPIMSCLVAKEDVLYAKLWIFLCKLLAAKFHQGFQVVNMLLTVVESGFKSHNIDIRLHAFICWQNLIDGFLLNPETFFTEKRFKLLMLPLKANNGRSENLVQVKFMTWCKLLNALDTKNVSSDAILEQFLQFCFGPLCQQPLFSWVSHANQMSQGKKYSSVHLMSCKALLQLFGLEQYIDNELQAKLKFFTFKNPKLLIENTNSKIVIDSVGECCVLLSQMQNSDRFECAAINEALWKSLFYKIDHLKDETLKQKCCEHLAALILALIGVARKRTPLITFGLVPLFDIIVTNEFKFFKNEEMSEMLFVHMVQAVMKKDKALLQYDVVEIFKKIFIFKSDDADFLKFVQIVLNRFSLNVTENLLPNKVAMLQNVWLLLEEVLKQHLSRLNSIKTELELCSSTFFEFLMWPVSTLNCAFHHEKIYLKWKELYYSFGLHTSETLLNALGIKILKSLIKLWEKGTHNLIIANITYFIVNNLNLKDYNEDHLSHILEIFTLLKSFVLMDDSSDETLKIFVKSIKKIFNNSKIYPFCLEDQILDCVNCLLTTHKNEEILEDITNFAKKFPNPAKYKSNFDKLVRILQQAGVKDTITDLVFKNFPEFTKPSPVGSFTRRSKRKCSQSDSETLDNRNRYNNLAFKSKEYPENIMKKDKMSNDLNDKAEKQQILTLLGHNVDTMSPVTLKSYSSQKKPQNTDLVFVNTPYKFNPKKMTKNQLEKLSKRRDDIPALYSNLSQSQSNPVQDNSTSFSELLEPKPESIPESMAELTKNAHKSDNLSHFLHEKNELESSNPFLELKSEAETEDISKSMIELTKNAHNSDNSSGFKAKNADLYEKHDKKSKNVPVKTISRRTSLNLERYDKFVPLARRKSTESDVKLIPTYKNIVSKAETKKKRGRKPKTEQSVIFDRTNEPNVNIAQDEINITTANLENILLKPETKKRGRKNKDPCSENEPVIKNQNVDDPDIPEVVKTRIKRELKRIQMDINDSDDYKKNEKRKTRASVSNSHRDTDCEGRKSVSPANQKKTTEQLSAATVKQEKCDELSKNCNIPVQYRFETVKSVPNDVTSAETSEQPRVAPVQQEKCDELTNCKSPVQYQFEAVNLGSNDVTSADTSKIPSAATVQQEKCDELVKPSPTDVIRTDHKNKSAEEHSAPTVEQKKCESDHLVDQIPEEIIKNCKIPVKTGEHLDVIESSQPPNPLTVLSVTSEGNPTCQKFEHLEETHTIDSKILAELDVQASEMLNIKDFSCRKVLFNSTTEEMSTLTDPKSDIATSPVFVDTPTRNKKLIHDTLEISPIKNASPTDVVRPHRKKTTLKSPGGRSAHILDMVAAKPSTPSSKNAKKPQQVSDFCFSPTQNRILKMMDQLEKNPEPEIKNEDILQFTKQLPSPFASPSGSILKKRKHSDADESAIRACKRRKVNFCDPPVSCRKFIEKHAKQKCPSSVKIDIVPQEARVTRSSSSQDELEPEIVENIEEVEEKTSNEVSVITKNEEFAEIFPDVQSHSDNSSPPAPSPALIESSTSAPDDAFTLIYDLLEQKKVDPETFIKQILSKQTIELLVQQLNAKNVLQLVLNQFKNADEDLVSEMSNLIPKPEKPDDKQVLGLIGEHVQKMEEYMQKINLLLPKDD